MNTTTIFLIILLAIILFSVGIYNRLIALRQSRKSAFADIDVQLKLRYNLVPQLVETVKGYTKHEKETFQDITNARAGIQDASSGPSADRISAENKLTGALSGLFITVENYPDLKADTNFRQLMSELSDIENKIAAARRYFNSATNDYNTQRQQFPANIIARYFSFPEEPFFEIAESLKEAVSKPPEVKF